MKRRVICMSLFYLSALSTMIYTQIANAEEYKHCEVESLSVEKGQRSANMTCYSGEIKPKWMECKQATAVHKKIGIVNCEEAKQLEAELETLTQKLDSLCGFCAKVPESASIKIENLGDDLSFFYMALKDYMVLSNVSVDSGSLLRADLVRNYRYGISPAQELMEHGGMPGFAKLGFGISDDVDEGSFQTGGSFDLPTPQILCKAVVERLKKDIEKTQNTIKIKEEMKNNCAPAQ